MRRNTALPLIIIVLVAIVALAATVAADNKPQLGLDLQGGFSVVLTAKGKVASDSVDKAKDIIRQRIDGLGVAEPEVTRQGRTVVIQLPGVKDRKKAQQIVGQTAKLQFRPVLEAPATGYRYSEALRKAGKNPCTTTPAPGSTTTTTAPGGSTTTAPGGSTTTAPGGSTTTAPASTTTAPATTTTKGGDQQGAPAFSAPSEGESASGPLPRQTAASTTAPATTTTTTTTTAPAASTTTAPTGSTTTAPAATTVPATTGDSTVVDPIIPKDGSSPSCLKLGPVGFEGTDLSRAKAELNSSTGEWRVTVAIKGKSKPQANTLFNACYSGGAECPTKQVAIVLDNVVQSAPVVQSQNLADQPSFEITGNFSSSEAKDLALVLRYGALPVEFEKSAEQQVSATLGKDSLHAGLVAGLIGLVLVGLYLLFYYRGLGLVAVLGMTVWAALMYSVISFLSVEQGLAMSLAGVTGIIVSVGTTVDSYIVYFERLKDEIQSGKTIRSSTERAFDRAFRTILTADVSSFIGAFLLWWLTVGPVRGFAFFLGLSVVLDIVVAYFFARPLVILLGRNRFFTEARFFGVARGLGQETAPAGGAE